MAIRIISLSRVEPFSWDWPEGPPGQFERGWSLLVEEDGRQYRLRHGITHRHTYGRTRVRSVTRVYGSPPVEAVAADDYVTSRGLVSVLKHVNMKHIRDCAEIPTEYSPSLIVRHRDEIRFAYSPGCYAIKASEDDLVTWVLHALVRARAKGRLSPGRIAATKRSENRVMSTDNHSPAYEPLLPSERSAVVESLLRFASAQTPGEWLFTPDLEADKFVSSDAFAFLLAVICDQGIEAERAWRVPFELKNRLGHLDPRRILEDSESVRRELAGDPSHGRKALVRYVNKVPNWVVAAAGRVINEYSGDAGRIWGDRPRARVLIDRLEAFQGIGQKKAAMSVELLARYLGVGVSDLDGSDVAYDIHIRRVFARTGLAELDTPECVMSAARLAYPPRPGALDGPAWLIGRKWCRPEAPNCDTCPIGDTCKRYIERAADIRGG